MNYVEFSYSKRRPKKLENGIFVLCIPERIKLQPGEVKIVDMKLHLKLSKNLVRGCVCIATFINITQHQTSERLSYFKRQFNTRRFTIQNYI